MQLVVDRTHHMTFKALVEIGQIVIPDMIGQETDLIVTRKVKIKA